MNRYHIKIGFRPEHLNLLKDLNNKLNELNWIYSEHCLDNLKYRIIDLENLLRFIKEIKLDCNNIFEYYSEGQEIIKICYRINYNKNLDIILVLTPDKKIVTIYINSIGDLHYTLKENIYCRP